MKMGAIHLGKGATLLSTFDLGALTEGVATQNGLGVLRVLVMPLSSQQTAIAPSADRLFKTSEMKSDLIAGLLKAIGVDEAMIATTGYTVIALEPVRRATEQKGLTALTAEERYFVLG